MKYPSYLDMVQTLLPVEEFLEFTKRYDQPVTKSIKILQQHAHHPHSIEGFDRTGILKRLTSDGRTCTPPRFSWEGRIYDDLLFVTKADNQSLGSHPLHQAGAFYVQEMAAGLPAQVLNVQPNHLVLDMCAAPGGKSVQLADFLASPLVKEDEGKVHNNGLLISNEPNPTRRKALEANLERCGIWNAVITGYDGQTIGNILKEQCDKVLLDAPCSGEGMQYKSDVNVYHWNEKAIRKLTQTQKSLLLSGLQALKIGGELVYSTCTTNVIENEGVIASILETLGDSIELLNVEIEEKSKGIPNPIIYNDTTPPTSHLSRDALMVHPNINKTDTNKTTPPTSRLNETDRGINITSKVARFRPHIHHTGGFFIAKFKKITTIPDHCREILLNHLKATTCLNATTHPNATTHLNAPKDSPIRTLVHHPTISNPNIILLQTKHTIRAVNKRFLEIQHQLFIQRAGLPIFKVLNNGERKPLPGLKKISAR